MKRSRYLRLLLFISVGVGVCVLELRAQQNQADLFVGGIDAPVDMIPVDQPVRPGFTIENGGPNNAQNFRCGVQIFDVNAAEVVFMEEIPVGGLNSGETLSLQTQNTWTPTKTGPHQIQVDIFYDQDTNPDNNSADDGFVVVGDVEDLLTLTEAIAILNSQVLDDHPRVDSLMAIHMSPPANPADSLIPPGLVIEGTDAVDEISYDEPVYFFFVDLYPDQFYEHPVEYVAISAIDGKVDRQAGSIWPTIDGAVPDVGVLCDAGPRNRRLIRGNRPPCAEKPNPYQPRATNNKQDWALVVVGALFKDIEEKTVQQDICMFKERMNGVVFGPKIDKDNIKVHDGPTNRGLTLKELCDAIEWFKGKACRKFYFKYIAHGKDDVGKGGRATASGLVLWKDDTRKSTVKMTWEELACKLKEAGIGEACIEITACYSGFSINHFNKKLRGIIMTSSSALKPTPVGDGSGTAWEKALLACSKDTLADFNHNDTIDPFELMAWILLQNPGKPKDITNPRFPDPKIRDLTDSIKIRGTPRRTISGKTHKIKGHRQGDMEAFVGMNCMARRVRKSGKKFKTEIFWRRALYFRNRGSSAKVANTSYRVIAKCGGRDTVIYTIQAFRLSLPPRTTRCVRVLPEGCTSIRLEKISGGLTDREKEPEILAVEDGGYVSSEEFDVVHAPNDFLFYRYDLRGESTTDRYTLTTEFPDGWNGSVSPGSFQLGSVDSAQRIYSGAFVPDSATVGGRVTSTIINHGIEDTLLVRYNVHLQDSLQGEIGLDDTFTGTWRWYDAIGKTEVKSKNVALEQVHIEGLDMLKLEGTGDWNLKDVTMNADSGVVMDFHVGASSTSMEWDNVVIRGLREGLIVEGGRMNVHGLVLGESERDGITFRGQDLLVDTLNEIHVIGAERHGLVFDNTGEDTLRLDLLSVDFADSNDIVVTNNSHVKCG